MDILNIDSNFLNYIFISLWLYFVGLLGILVNKKNFIYTLMSLEIMFLGISLLFITLSFFQCDLKGYIFSLLILTVAAAESALALAMLVIYFKVKGSIDIESAILLRN